MQRLKQPVLVAAGLGENDSAAETCPQPIRPAPTATNRNDFTRPFTRPPRTPQPFGSRIFFTRSFWSADRFFTTASTAARVFSGST